MKLETKFEIDDIVRYDGYDWRVWHIEITLDDNSEEPVFDYLLIEPMDSYGDYSVHLDESKINNATLVRSRKEEFARLGIEL